MRSQLNIAYGVREFARATPGALAVEDGDRQLSFAALDERARRVADALRSRGLAAGARVALMLGNRLEYAELAAGIARAGAVMVPLNPRLTSDEVTHILEHSGSEVLVVDEAYASLVAPVLDSSPVRIVLSIGGSELGIGYEAALDAARSRDVSEDTDEREPFCIAYTSGTTGKPKGVVISHRSRTLVFYCGALEWRLGPGRRTIAVAPLYHGAGFAFGYGPLCTGASVLMHRRFEPDRLLHQIEHFGAQSVFLVPTHAQLIRELGPQALGAHDLSCLDLLYFNAAPLRMPLKEWVLDEFPATDLHEVYGSTEAAIVTDLRPSDQRRKPGSVGQPWFMTELRVVRPDGSEVEPGEVGELYSRSPFLMNGYHEAPEQTAECTMPDGFLTAGDLACLDEEGFVTIVDRVKDMVITGGVNVYPAEIELVLAAHPAVREVAVAGLASERWGEEVTAFVVVEPPGVGGGGEGAGGGAGASPGSGDFPGGGDSPEHYALSRSLDEHARSQLAAFKVPRRYVYVDSLPRNSAGKVLKRQLREEHGSAVSPATGPAATGRGAGTERAAEPEPAVPATA